MRPRPALVAVALLVPLVACGAADAFPPPGTTCPLFPADNVWHSDISQLPVHPRSAAWMSSMDSASTNLHPDFGPSGGQPYGIPYDVVGASHQDVPVDFYYPDESDDVLYPFGPDITIEGGSDRHAIMVDKDTCVLYELFDATYRPNGGSTAGSGAVFDLRSNALRPAGWTSADAAGLPILAGLIRRDEVVAGTIDHAIRFTAQDTDTTYVWPARHQAGERRDPDLPPMGARFRMKAGFSLNGFSQEARVILQAMKTYGLIPADNGSNWYVGGASENGWSNDVLDELKSVPASAFEAVDASSLMIDPNSGQARQGGGVGGGTPVSVADFSFTPATVTVA